jgi:hypothetical protein
VGLMKNLAAWTAPGGNYPPYISINEDEKGSVLISVREKPGFSAGKQVLIQMSNVEFSEFASRIAWWWRNQSDPLVEVLEEQEADIPAGIPEVHVIRTDENPPDDGISLTAGGDVQRDRLEISVYAWGRAKES